MRFFNITLAVVALLGTGLLSGCCGNVDVSGLPCYKEMFEDPPEQVIKREYQLDQKRAPKYNK